MTTLTPYGPGDEQTWGRCTNLDPSDPRYVEHEPDYEGFALEAAKPDSELRHKLRSLIRDDEKALDDLIDAAISAYRDGFYLADTAQIEAIRARVGKRLLMLVDAGLDELEETDMDAWEEDQRQRDEDDHAADMLGRWRDAE